MPRIAAALIALMLAGAASAQMAPDWSIFPGFFSPGFGGIVIADLDGDAVNEVVTTGSGGDGFSPLGTRFLAVVNRNPGDPVTFQVRYLRRLVGDETFIGRIVRVRPTGATTDRIFATVDSTAGTRLVQYGGGHLDPLVSTPVTKGFLLDHVADVDADGMLEAIGCTCGPSYNGPGTVIDVATGVVEWIDSGTSTSIRAGQLDGDAALELVLSGTPGRVIDGATHAVQWSDPSGFLEGGRIVFGNFRGSAADQEFAIVSSWGTTKIYTTVPTLAVAIEFTTNEAPAVTTVDVNGDGVDEIVVGEGQWGALKGFSTSDGSLAFSVPNPEHGVSAVAVGELDGKPGLEIVHGAGLTSSGRDILRIVSINTGAELYNVGDEAGPHSSVALADIDKDGYQEAIYATGGSNSGYSGSNLVVADAQTGIVLRRLNSVLQPWGGNAGLSFEILNIDADPQLEICAAAAEIFDGRVLCIDGITFEPQWVANVGSFKFVSDLALIPSGGAIPNFAAAVYNTQNGGVQAVVLNGVNGSELWRSSEFTGAYEARLAVGNLDGDANTEIALSAGSKIYVLDPVTSLVDRIMLAGGTLIGQRVEAVGANCYHVQVLSSELNRYRCDNGAFVSKRTFPFAATYVGFPDNSFGALVLSDGHHLALESNGAILAQSVDMGAMLGAGDRGAVRVAPEGVSVLIGSEDSVNMVTLVDLVFAGGFE